jgi:hypothetical protein
VFRLIGILLGLITFGERVVDSAHKAVQSSQGYKRGLERRANGIDNTNTYFDWRGMRKDLDTHEYRSVDLKICERNGEDQCIRDIRGNVVRNLSEERRNLAFERAKLNSNNTVSLYRKYGNGAYGSGEHRNLGGDGYCEGTQYKDLKTGEIYVARYFKGVIVYMDFNGRLIRESDETKKARTEGEEFTHSASEIQKYINEYNLTRTKKCDLGAPRYNSGLYLYDLDKVYMNDYKVL